MKIRYILLNIAVLLFVTNAIAQDINSQKFKTQKIKLKKYEFVPDSAIATWDLIVSSPSFSKEKKKSLFKESMNGAVSVNFSPDDEKGIIYVDFENLPKELQPFLSISNEKGDPIYETQVRFANNIINMRKLPPGTYLFTADMDEEVSTWEFVKE